MNTEIEKETKFLLCAAQKDGVYSESTRKILFSFGKCMPEPNDHLITYYDKWNDCLLKDGHTFRLTLRRHNGVDKHRATIKLNRSNTSTVRTCEEFHFPLSKDVNPFKNELFVCEFLQEIEDLLEDNGLPVGYYKKKCWIRVTRYNLQIKGINCNLDICKTNKGIYFEELETEDPITEEWINFLRARYGVTWLSNVNKYKRTRLVNEM